MSEIGPEPIPSPRWRRAAALGGIIGAGLLGASFGMLPTLPPASASTGDLIKYAQPIHTKILIDAWLEGTGTVLYVIFVLALLQLNGRARPLARQVTTLAATLIVSVSLLYDVAVIALGQSVKIGGGQLFATPAVAWGTYAAAEHIFLITPPIFLPLGVALLGGRALPRPFGYSAIVCGLVSIILGFVGLLTVSASNNGPVGAAINYLIYVESAWIIVAAVFILVTASRRGRLDAKAPSVPAYGR